jgi:predicted Zn finger-like uncharacterized protein
MNKPRIITECWECKAKYPATRKSLATAGQYTHCPKCDLKFRAWLTGLASAQN